MCYDTKNFDAVLIWYTGHGQKNTGNWVLKDGFLSFKDIYDLYKTYFKGRYLYVVSDCCYSGAWVLECARLLDMDDIKCIHAAERHHIYIKVFAACLPDEPAYDKFYTECNGVKLQLHKDHCNKTIKFAEHRKLHHGTCSQTTLGVDFTHNNMCVVGKDGVCHPYTWTKHVQNLLGTKGSHDYLI